MNFSNRRTRSILLVLCLALVLTACGGTDTPQDQAPTQTATATPTLTAEPQASATATATTTPTAEPTQPATVTPEQMPTDPPELATATSAPPSEPQEPAVPTSTATDAPTASPTPPPSRCQGLSGQLEVQVLVGPAEAVGLDPVAVGSVPFAVITTAPPYRVEGQGPISYDARLTQEWGTYGVSMDLQAMVRGECSGAAGSERLDLVLTMTGDQHIAVESEGFSREYPWSGTQSLDLVFPVEEGAAASGQGWVVVLHLNNP